MSAIKQMHAVLRFATSGKSPLGTGYTGKEIQDAIKAGKSDDRRLDAREKNLLSYYLTYRGNGMNDSGTREFKKAYRTLNLPRNPVTDREYVRANGSAAKPTLAKLHVAQNRVSTAVFRAGANGIGIGDGRLSVTLPKNDATVRRAIDLAMQNLAPGVPYEVRVVGVIRPE